MSKIINRYLSTAMVFTIDCVMFRHLTNRGRIRQCPYYMNLRKKYLGE